ncbi:hypothetical protein ACWFMI_11735 [Nocardiopsis terrae]
MPKSVVTAAAILVLLLTGCDLGGVRELVPSADEREVSEPGDQGQETPVPGAEEPVGDPERTSGPERTSEPEPGEPPPEPGEPAPDPGSEPAPDPGAGTGEAAEPEGTAVPEESEEAGEAGEELPDEAAEYMAALAASDDPERMREGLTLTAEDSTAHTYLRHHVQLFSAWDSAGDPRPSATLEPSEEGFELCRPEVGEPVCVVFDRFTTEDGLITGFLIDGQDPGKRLVSGSGVAASSEGVDVHLLTAYQSVTDDALVVTAEFTTVDNVALDLFGATYTAPDGHEYRAEEAVGEYELDAGTATQTALFFSGPEVGGDLAVTGCLDECFATVDLEFPVG